MKKIRSRSFVTISALSLGALVASCGGSSASGPAPTFAPDTLIINAVPSLRFETNSYGPVPAGKVAVAYVNVDTVRHTLIIAKDGSKVANFRLVIGKQGSSDVGTADLEAGTYELICDVPGHGEMKASLTVK